MTSPESCCAAGFAVVSDIGGHYNTAYGQSIPLVNLSVVKGRRLKKCRKLSKTRLIFRSKSARQIMDLQLHSASMNGKTPTFGKENCHYIFARE
jgi:hypothetical protein